MQVLVSGRDHLVPCLTQHLAVLCRTCKEVYESGVRKSGTYHLQYSTGDTFEQDCEMDIEGGGWTQIVDLCNACATGALHNAISCDAEKQTVRHGTCYACSCLVDLARYNLRALLRFGRTAICGPTKLLLAAGSHVRMVLQLPYVPRQPFSFVLV